MFWVSLKEADAMLPGWMIVRRCKSGREENLMAPVCLAVVKRVDFAVDLALSARTGTRQPCMERARDSRISAEGKPRK